MNLYVKLVLVVLFALCSPSLLAVTLRFVRQNRARLNMILSELQTALNLIPTEETMKYKTESSVKSQEFTPYEKDYVLNPVSNELEEKPISKNVQEYIQSHIDCALERALERFLPKVTAEVDDVEEYTSSVADLAVLGEAMEVAEAYREQFGLSEKFSMADIYAEVDKRAQELKSKLGQVVAPKVKEESDEN